MADTAVTGCTTTYAALSGQVPVFSGGVALGGWQRCAEDLPGLPPQACGQLLVAPLPPDICQTSLTGA